MDRRSNKVKKTRVLIRVEGGVVTDVWAGADMHIDIFDIDELKEDPPVEKDGTVTDLDELFDDTTAGLMRVY